MNNLTWKFKDNVNALRLGGACMRQWSNYSSNNGLSPGRRTAIVWTNEGILLIATLATNFREILIEIHTFSSKKIHLNMSSAKWRLFSIGLNVLKLKYLLSNLTTDKSTTVQEMARCVMQQTTNCWPRSMTPYGPIRRQWFIVEIGPDGRQSVAYPA